MIKSKPDISIQCRDEVLDLRTPKIMGVLNVTPDSFSDGGEFNAKESAVKRAGEMINEGADIIDIGGESTRPGSDPVSADEEIRRTIPVVREIINTYPNALVSIDTTKFEVALKAVDAGVHFINDVSGLEKEPRFADLCSETGAAYICMHSRGEPKTMQDDPQYDNVVDEIKGFFEDKLEILDKTGVQNVILDPGIGFGKKLEHNLKIIASLDHFSTLNCPLLIGASRKSMIGQILDGRSVDGRLSGTIAVHYHSLINGASILRVHDVQEAQDSIKIFNAVKAAGS